MDRLQRNCVLVSASLHSVLAAAFLFGSAFLSPSSKAPDLDVLTVIPDVLVDAPFSGGGNPNVKQSAAPPPQPRIQQPVAPQPAPAPAPIPPPPEKTVKAEPVTPEPAKALKSAEPDLTQPPTGRRRPVVNTQLTERKTNPRNRTAASNADSDSDADERAAVKAADARRRVVAGALANIGNLASSSTSVEIPGPGGQAYASYGQALKTIYQSRYQTALLAAGDIADGYTEASISVTIARDGTVLSTRITKPSPNERLNRLIQRVLDSIREVRPFPEGAKDSQRTFDLIFDLTPRNKLG